MPRQYFYDVPGGHTVLYDVVDTKTGYKQPVFMLPEEDRFEQFRAIADIKFSKDDILLNSYPKTGTNWTREMLFLILMKTSDKISRVHGLIESQTVGTVDQIESPKIVNTHLRTEYLPREAVTKKIKMLLVCRNPKDVLVSFYNHTKGFSLYNYEGRFENYFEMFIRGDVDYGSYGKYLLSWQHFIKSNPDIPVHILYYEDLQENALSEMKKVCQFLQLDISDDDLSEIVDNCQFSKMRKGKMQAMDENRKE